MAGSGPPVPAPSLTIDALAWHDDSDRVIADPAEVFVAVEETVRDYRPTNDKNVNSVLAKIGRGARVDYAAGMYLRFVRGVPLSEYQPRESA